MNSYLIKMNKTTYTKQVNAKIIAVLIIATITLLLSFASPSLAHNKTNSTLEEAQARAIAREYLNERGYSRIGTSSHTARVGKAQLIDNTWIVNINYGGRFAAEKGQLLIDELSGEITELKD